ncbi:MAG: type I glyceraldehyde-3-phosphate dehydrogenase, partial [Alkalinema sp. FL-bin-369]|nr:type I glyceraldehyde-3-phosphate dehydrogenase [Leptolyngbyaceae cyanobacterium LF-bin-369]
MIRVAINGFGRIGRSFLRCWVERPNSGFTVVGLNDTSDPRTNAHLIRYDTIMGRFRGEVTADDNS